MFAAVTEEVDRLLRLDTASMSRYEDDGTHTLVAISGRLRGVFHLGQRWKLGGRTVSTLIFETGRPARLNSYSDATGTIGVTLRELDLRQAVGAPIIVEDRLWGSLSASLAAEHPLPADTEARLASFTELVATAIANTGIHPAILSEGGLTPALKALARRSAVPVELDLRTGRRLPGPVEVAAYYAVSEALANAAKHARASVVHVEVDALDATLRLTIRDDGIGGADPARGSGLTGLRDRIEAVGGTFNVTSPDGGGTTLLIEIPV